MPPQAAKSLMKEFRASFRRKKAVPDQGAKASTAVKAVSDEELAKVAEMKEDLGDQVPPFYDDMDLLSFLRARSMNIKEAEKLLKLDENTRRFLGVNNCVIPWEFAKYNFSSLIGVDKEGSLVRLVNVGGIDVKGVFNTLPTIKGLTLLICMVNYDLKQQALENKKSGRKCTQLVVLVNLDGFTMAQATYKPAFDMFMQCLKLLQDHYHDTLKKVYVLNQPPFFASVYKLIKPAMQEYLQRCVEFVNEAELLKRIDADVLPKYLGGNRVDSKGDPRCTEFVHFGGTVPTSLYCTNFLDPADPEVTTLTIPAGGTITIRVAVRQPGSIVKWHLQSKDNDIAVGLFREPLSSGMESPKARRRNEDLSKLEKLSPVVRIQCHVCPEFGSAISWFAGNVVLCFDNSYSWVNSKEVWYKYSILPPTEVEKNFLNSPESSARGPNYMLIAPE